MPAQTALSLSPSKKPRTGPLAGTGHKGNQTDMVHAFQLLEMGLRLAFERVHSRGCPGPKAIGPVGCDVIARRPQFHSITSPATAEEGRGFSQADGEQVVWQWAGSHDHLHLVCAKPLSPGPRKDAAVASPDPTLPGPARDCMPRLG